MMRSVTASTAQFDTAEWIKKIQDALAADNLSEVRRLTRTVKRENATQAEVEKARAFTSTLPLAERTCLDLHFEGYGNAQIAQLMGCRVDAVDHMLAEILSDLRVHLGD